MFNNTPIIIDEIGKGKNCRIVTFKIQLTIIVLTMCLIIQGTITIYTVANT